MELPRPILETIQTLSKMPGIGTKSAERLVFLMLEKKLINDLHSSLEALQTITECPQCHFYTDNICPFCSNYSRTDNVLCIVETPLDALILERTGVYNGQYHILHNTLSPLRGIIPSDLRLHNLLERTQNKREVILATGTNMESEATALYICDMIKPVFNGTISILARGMPSHSDMTMLDGMTVLRAFQDRQGVQIPYKSS